MQNHLLEYRRDIDGLRAIAVMSVVFFHLFPNSLKGGFLGVDIFFVISGYLITKLNLKRIINSRFTLWEFYSKRIKRIFPALILMLSLVSIYGYCVLFPNEFESLNKHIAAASTFLSNLVLYKEIGYFDVTSDKKILLHLWSLSIEEQFYLVWPLFLWGIYRFYKSIPNLRLGMFLMTVVSYGIYLYYSYKHPNRAFYFPLSRAWELSAGALIASYELSSKERSQRFLASYPLFKEKILNALPYLSLGVLVVSIACLNQAVSCFKYFIVFPVLSTCFLILHPQNSWVYKILCHPVLTFIGLISYPLYLFHWPLISFVHIIDPSKLNWGVKFGILSFSTVLAWGFYKYIETPIRRSTSKVVPLGLLGILIGMGGIAYSGYLTKFPPLIANKVPGVLKITEAFDDWEYPSPEMKPLKYNLETFYQMGQGEDIVLFFGDSNMEQYGPRVSSLVKSNKVNKRVIFATKGGMCPIRKIGRTPEEAALIETIYQFALSPQVKRIVISAAWIYYLEGKASNYYFYDLASPGLLANQDIINKAFQELEDMIKNFSAHGKEVHLMLGIPWGSDYNPRGFFSTRNFYGEWQLDIKALSSKKAWDGRYGPIKVALLKIAQRTGTKIIDPEKYLCTQKSCKVLDSEGKPIYKDEGHLRPGYVRRYVTFLDHLVE